jgi:hypothetical protein
MLKTSNPKNDAMILPHVHDIAVFSHSIGSRETTNLTLGEFVDDVSAESKLANGNDGYRAR